MEVLFHGVGEAVNKTGLQDSFGIGESLLLDSQSSDAQTQFSGLNNPRTARNSLQSSHVDVGLSDL